MISLDAPLQFWSRSGSEDGPSLHEFAIVEAPESLPDMTVLREALPELLCGLDDDEIYILGWRFGLVDGRARNLGEIADILAAIGKPLSFNDLYAVEQHALAKLRHPEIAAAIAAILGETPNDN
ncbi:hypothetical protein SE17_00700 [Kouleothrix aurantiaca]|uniref:Uncharacterized protein n=1 Tax=Kouleothrix aurantiaca TaxID=186479 RepID=A0A0P9D7F1_9CHLR|nr:hypothetical protein SE17_00700 [Kouleothrix aurantiaca]